MCVCVCPWFAISAATSPANEFNSSVLWLGFILQRENPPLQLESSLWPWQTVICQESASLEFSFLLLAPMDWAKHVLKILEPPKILAWFRRAISLWTLHVCMRTLYFSTFSVFALFTHMYNIITCAPPHWMLNSVPPGSQPCRSSEPFICSAVRGLRCQLIQISA